MAVPSQQVASCSRNGLGLSTGIDVDQLAWIGDDICQALGKVNQSKAGRALMARQDPK